MTSSAWNPALHDAAKKRALELRREALDTFFRTLGLLLKRWMAGRTQPEA